MLHNPGPDALTAAERAVEYARMVGARDIEMNARLTLGGLMVDSGDIEPGLAQVYRVKEQVATLGDVSVMGRAFVNLPSHLEGIGRSQEAVAVLQEGVDFARGLGLPDTEAWVWGNLADSLHSLGRWTEAAEAADASERVGQSAKPRAFRAKTHALLALARGDLAEAGRQLSAARGHFGTHDKVPQHELPLARLAVGIAVAEGRLLDARAELRHVLDTGFPPGTQRYAWPVLLIAATAEADARGLHTVDAGRSEILDRIRTAAKSLAANVPVWQAYERWVRTELLRAEARCTPDDWAEVVAAFECLDRPYDLARVRYRLAEALLPSGGEDERDRAAELLRLAHAVADHLGARPLADAAALLAQRARLPLTHTPKQSLTPADPADALGLTGRERDVLRLVSMRPHQPPDRRGTLHLPEDRQRPRLQHPVQTRRLGQGRGGGGGASAGVVRPRLHPGSGSRGEVRRTVPGSRRREAALAPHPGIRCRVRCRGPAGGAVFNMFEELFAPGRKHTRDEQNRLELTREDVGDGDPGRGPIDLASGKVVVRQPTADEDDTESAAGE